MNELQIFENPQFGEIRVVEKDGETWFVSADVCRALGLVQVSRAMDRLDDDERGLVKVTHPQSPSKTMDVNAVTEPGLYHASGLTRRLSTSKSGTQVPTCLCSFSRLTDRHSFENGT